MKSNEKLKLNKNALASSDTLFNAIRCADENDLRVMLSLSILSPAEEIDLVSLRDSLELSEGEFDASVKYWCGAGLIKKTRGGSSKGEKKETAKKIVSVAPAHKNGLVERKTELPSYTTAELSDLIEKRRITAEFINEAQRVMGKMFNTHDINILVGMVDYIGFDEASVIIILSHMANLGKKSLRYAEQLAFSLYDEGVTDAESLQARLCKMEEYSKSETAVRSMFGMTGRSLTAKEKKFLRSWIETMGFDVECIRLAYDITVDATHSPAPAYANSILESWYASGLTTREAIIAAEEAKKAEKDGAKKNDKSYDTDEFFAAALRRSFEEFNKQ